MNPGPAGSSPAYFTPFKGRVFFRADDGDRGSELWATDGTAAGTVLVKDISDESNVSSLVWNLTVVGDTLFFTADDGVHGMALWKTDGTPEGTVLVRDIWPGEGYSNISDPVACNGVLYFTADSPNYGYELWRSDGTESGTYMVRDLYPGPSSGRPVNTCVVNDRLIFQAWSQGQGMAVWVSDGTAAGTVRLTGGGTAFDIPAPSHLIAAGDHTAYFFNQYHGQSTAQLWRTDGTAAGTVQVAALSAPAGAHINARPLGRAGGVLYFHCTTDAGIELWQSDGTAAGTFMVQDVRPGAGGSGPAALWTAGGRVYFTADDGAHGAELWSFAAPPPLPAPPVADADTYGGHVGRSRSVVAPGVLGNDTRDTASRQPRDGDADGTPDHLDAAPADPADARNVGSNGLVARLVSGPAHGSLQLNPDGSFTYTPDLLFSGTDGFTYQAADGYGVSPPAAVTIAVDAVNDAPDARDDVAATAEGRPVAGNVLANDADIEGDAITASVERSPAHGSLALDPDGAFTYTPAAGFRGTDAFTYRASDGLLADTAAVTITVNPLAATVGGRYVFYNRSAYDGSDPAPNVADDGAVARDKTALLPNQTATVQNYTSYSRGINGVIVDIAGVPAGVTLTADDFAFRSGNTPDPGTWAAGPRSSRPQVSVRRQAGWAAPTG